VSSHCSQTNAFKRVFEFDFGLREVEREALSGDGDADDEVMDSFVGAESSDGAEGGCKRRLRDPLLPVEGGDDEGE